MLAKVSLWVAPPGTYQLCAAGVRASSRHRAASSGGRSPALTPLTTPFSLRTPPWFPQTLRRFRPPPPLAARWAALSAPGLEPFLLLSPPAAESLQRQRWSAHVPTPAAAARRTFSSALRTLSLRVNKVSQRIYRAQSQQWRLLDWRMMRKLKYEYCTVENMGDGTLLNYK